MTESGERARAFRFGRFEVDTRARELLKDGIRVRLQGQPFDVLVMLLERPDDVLTREELRQKLWPEGTFVDFEHGLNAAVKRLRAALGDNAQQPHFIQTLHRRGYRFIGAVERQDDDRDESSPAVARRRLALLPFTGGPSDGAQAYFSEGLREEMITRLGRLCAGRVGVVARTSSRLIQRRTFRIRDIGRALRVDYVVEGSVRFNGSRGRITIRLIETQGETQLWADSYERQLADCFQVQAEMATEIAQSLALELLPPAASVPQIGTGSAEAYQAYLKGRYHWNRPEDEGCLQAIACFEEAISLDSRFASAHSALAMVYAGAVRYERVEPRPALVRARDAALRALELDPADAEAHLTLGEVERILEWNWARAEKAYRMALACNPSNERAHRLYGLYLAMRGRPAEAAVEADRAYDLDPLCLVVNTSAAMVRYLTRDPHAAIARCRRTLDMDSAFAPARGLLAAGLIAAGCLDEAACELDALAVGPLEPSSLAWLAHGRAATGEVARASVIVERLEALTRQRYVSAYLRAIAHLAVGDANGAIALLGQASEQRDPALTTLAVDPRLDALSGDSRYRALVDRLALDK